MPDSEIKVLHLIGGDLGSGAGKGAYSLHRGLLVNGIYSRVLTDSRTDFSDRTVCSVAKSELGKLARAVRRRMDAAPTLFYPNREKVLFSTGFAGYDFTKTEAYAEASIIHLHWVNNGFVSMRHLHKTHKPLVWTLRDMWPMTGGCHYSMGCTNYIANCGSCPQMNSNSKLDLSRIVSISKQKNIPNSIKMVGISHWISEKAKESSLFKTHDVRTIFNNIDTHEFSPVEKTIARAALGIQTDKKIILVGARSLNDLYKGLDKFLAAIRHLNKNEYHLCFFGDIDQCLLVSHGYSFNALGFLHDTISLRLAYSVADVFVAPSTMDAFGKTLAEAMACGTPVVCFDATGPQDIVDHMVNGYRATPFEPEDIAKGINWVCKHPDYAKLTQAARDKSVGFFDSNLIARQYIDLYREILALKV